MTTERSFATRSADGGFEGVFTDPFLRFLSVNQHITRTAPLIALADTIIFGSKWKYPDNPKTFNWVVRLRGK